jgi:hypothetical protein
MGFQDFHDIYLNEEATDLERRWQAHRTEHAF